MRHRVRKVRLTQSGADTHRGFPRRQLFTLVPPFAPSGQPMLSVFEMLRFRQGGVLMMFLVFAQWRGEVDRCWPWRGHEREW